MTRHEHLVVYHNRKEEARNMNRKVMRRMKRKLMKEIREEDLIQRTLLAFGVIEVILGIIANYYGWVIC